MIYSTLPYLTLYILRRTSARGSCRQPPSAAALVAGLAAAVPGFADSAAWRGQRVQLHRKAVELAADLAARFGGEDPRFAFADAADLPADSGAHRPSLQPMPTWVRVAAVQLPALPFCRCISSVLRVAVSLG